MFVKYDECIAAGLDPDKVGKIAQRLERAANDAAKLKLLVFGGTNNLSLRFEDDPLKGKLIIADCGFNGDGGDGATMEDEDGLERGEH